MKLLVSHTKLQPAPSFLRKPMPLTILSGRLSAIATVALILGSGMSAFPQDNNPTPLQQAIVVVRHGEDLDNNKWILAAQKGKLPAPWSKIAPSWPTYSTPIGEVTVSAHRLNAEGEEQAVFLRDHLPGMLASMGYAPITRVITKKPDGTDPDGKWPTSNPFDTIYPYLNRAPGGFKDELILIKSKKESNPLLDQGLVDLLPNEFLTPPKMSNTMLPATGSTLLCWDAEGLWGLNKTVDQVKSRPFDENCILRMLGGRSIGDFFKTRPQEAGGGCPGKAARVYVFMKRPGTPTATAPQKFDCDVFDIKLTEDGKRYFYLTAELRVDEVKETLQITVPKSGVVQEVEMIPKP
ncbi:MAG: hypothetical protein ACOYM3_12125 [Terrimicrobiaceae bacterium]